VSGVVQQHCRFLWKWGEVVIEKTAVVFFHTQLTKLQNEHKEAFLVLHQICNGDVSGLTDDIQEVLVQHHLMNEDGTVEKILKGFIAAMVTIEGSHSTSGSSGNSDSKKPTEKTGLMPQPKITSIQDALKSGTLKAHRKE